MVSAGTLYSTLHSHKRGPACDGLDRRVFQALHEATVFSMSGLVVHVLHARFCQPQAQCTGLLPLQHVRGQHTLHLPCKSAVQRPLTGRGGLSRDPGQVHGRRCCTEPPGRCLRLTQALGARRGAPLALRRPATGTAQGPGRLPGAEGMAGLCRERARLPPGRPCRPMVWASPGAV